MRRAVVLVLLLLAAWQAYAAVQWSRYAWLYASAREKDDAAQFAAALELMERAVLAKPDAARARVWTGDVASRHLGPPPSRLTPPEEKAVLDRAWAGYAGAVAIAPLDSWCWSGIAEIAVREAQLSDRVNGVSLDDIAARGRGVLDPWRAMALGAAHLAVSISPAGYPELDVLAGVYESSGEVERAAETYVRSARLMSAPSFHTWGRGRSFSQPIYERLMAALVAGIAAAPTYDRSLFHVQVARFAREQGDRKTAVAQARLAESEARNAYERYRAAAELGEALEADDPQEAVKAWRRAELTRYDPGLVASHLAVLEAKLGDVREACGHFRTALRDDPANAALRMEGSAACEKAGEIDSADRLLRDGVTDPVKTMELAEALVMFLERNNRQLSAHTLVSEWAREHPDRAEFKAWLARSSAPGSGPAR